MSPIAGWYADPSDAAQLRWWDGSTWTDDTRAQAPHTAPPPPGAAATPPTPPPSGYASPGDGYGSAGTYANPGGYGASGEGSPGSGFSYGFASAPTAGTGLGTVPPPAAKPDRSWVSWASIGAAIAVALAVIVVLSVSLLGHQSNTPSSQGLATPTTAGGSGAATTAPTTSSPTTALVAPPPDSAPFSDPGGVYSISVNTAWEPPPESIGGVQLWYLTGVNYGGFRSNLNIVTQTVPAGLSLANFVQQNVQGLSRSTNFHVSGTTNITLADGTAAAVVSYTGSELGEAVAGQATLTVHGTHAVVVTVLAATDAAGTTFSLVNPYVATLHLN